MDWTAVGAIAETVGAVAVVLTLAYLAKQVSHSTQTTRRAAASGTVLRCKNGIGASSTIQTPFRFIGKVS